LHDERIALQRLSDDDDEIGPGLSPGSEELTPSGRDAAGETIAGLVLSRLEELL